MIIYDKNNGRGRFQTAYFIVLGGTGPEIGDPVLGNRPSAVLKAVSAHGRKRPTKRAGFRFPNGQRAVLGPVLEFSSTRSQGRFGIMCQTLSKTGGNPF
jgi:hypothetical protein